MSNLKAIVTGNASNAVSPAVAFKNMLESRRAEFAAALPKHMSADRVIRLALTEFTKNPGLRECTLQSIYSGIIQASQLGLEIGVLGQAYLVPYNNKIKGRDGKPDAWRKEAQFIPGYKGLISLARRSGEVTSIETHIVYANDLFNLTLGIESKVEHKPNLDGDRGKPKLVYGVAHFKDGGYHFEWMSIGDVDKIRARSKSKDNGPWVTDYEQMVRKTLVRRMANYLPMSIELAAAIQVDEAATAGKAAAIDGDFNVITDEDDVATPALERNGGGETIDHSTGEVTSTSTDGAKAEAAPADKPKAAARKPAASAAPPVITYAIVSEKLKAAFEAKDVDLLDAHASLIKEVADATVHKELTDLYHAYRSELQGE